MKKIALLTLLVGLSYSQIITILDNGIERKIEVVDTSKFKARAVNSLSSGIVIAFKDKTIDINEFASKYNLTLKKHLKIGYYIFANNSNVSDIELISKILKSSKKRIKTIRPNWGFGMEAR